MHKAMEIFTNREEGKSLNEKKGLGFKPTFWTIIRQPIQENETKASDGSGHSKVYLCVLHVRPIKQT